MMRRCKCGRRIRYVVTYAVGGWGVERCCDGCGPLETLSRGWPSREMAQEEMFALVEIETGRPVDELRRIYLARAAQGTKGAT